MEDIDGGLHPAVDGQSLDEMRKHGTTQNNKTRKIFKKPNKNKAKHKQIERSKTDQQ